MLIDTQLTRDEIARETDRAILFRIQGPAAGALYSHPGREVWMPKSQVTWMRSSPVYAETAHIPAWLARKL